MGDVGEMFFDLAFRKEEPTGNLVDGGTGPHKRLNDPLPGCELGRLSRPGSCFFHVIPLTGYLAGPANTASFHS